MTLWSILEYCYGIDLEKTNLVLREGADVLGEAEVKKSLCGNELVLDSITEDISRLVIDDVDVDDHLRKTRIYVI